MHFDEGMDRRLDTLASRTERSRDELIHEAVDSYVTRVEAEIDALDEAEASIARGNTVSDEDVHRWLIEQGMMTQEGFEQALVEVDAEIAQRPAS